jgi:hypothetical protein
MAALRSNPFAEVRELREAPQDWQLVNHGGGDYFVVLKRRP